MADGAVGPQHYHIGADPPVRPCIGQLWVDIADPADPVLKVKVVSGWRVLANLGNP